MWFCFVPHQQDKHVHQALLNHDLFPALYIYALGQLFYDFEFGRYVAEITRFVGEVFLINLWAIDEW